MNLCKKSTSRLRNAHKRSFSKIRDEEVKYTHLNSLLDKTSYRASSTILNDVVKGGQEVSDESENMRFLKKDSSILFRPQEGTTTVHLKDMLAE